MALVHFWSFLAPASHAKELPIAMCSYQSMFFNIWLIMHSCMMFLHCLVFKEHLRFSLSFREATFISYLVESLLSRTFSFSFQRFFPRPSPAPCTPLPLCPVRWRLIYNTQIRGRCQYLFSFFSYAVRACIVQGFPARYRLLSCSIQGFAGINMKFTGRLEAPGGENSNVTGTKFA